MNTIKGMIEDLRRDETHIGGCTTKGELIIALESLERNDKYIKEIDHLHKYIAKLETRIVEQESKSEWQKDHEILKAYSDGANGVLDELRAEIEEIETYDGIYIDRAYVLQIINKYKTESEEQVPPERDCVNCVYSKDGHKFMPKRIKASDIKPDDEWMQEDVWDEIYKAGSED